HRHGHGLPPSSAPPECGRVRSIGSNLRKNAPTASPAAHGRTRLSAPRPPCAAGATCARCAGSKEEERDIMTIIDIAGEPFNVRMDGPENAPVLMLSNSLSSNMSMWDAQVRAWQSRFRILRYDSRGHGGSVAPDRPYS